MATTANGKTIGRPKGNSGKYTPAIVTQGLMALVAIGNPREASAQLKTQGIEIPHGTLANWRTDTHAEQYAQLAAKYGAELEKHAVHNALIVGQAATEVQMLAIEKAKVALNTNRDQSPAQTALNMSKVVAQASEQHARLTGRPTQVIEFRNADDLLESIMKKAGIVDTTAEDA